MQSNETGLLTGKISLVLIEDNYGDAEIVRELLQGADGFGFDLVHFTRLSSGMEFIAEAPHIDLVLLDLNLPDGYGVTNVQRVKAVNPDIPLVILTGSSDQIAAIQLVQNGAQDYLVKGELNSSLLIRSILYSIERNRTVRQLRKVRELEQFLAYYDALTKLPNRVLFFDRLDKALQRQGKGHTSICVMFLDIDEFKFINDTFGHGIGDLCLKTIASRLQNCVRDTDTVARLAGDEFIILFENLSSPEHAISIAKKILFEISEPLFVEDAALSLSGSLGICMNSNGNANGAELVKNADLAMYHAKEEGKNLYKVYNSALELQKLEESELTTSLKEAVRKNELELYYQPIIDSQSNEIISIEALLRWNHSARGIISPAVFIPLAEKSSLINSIGEWVIRTACKTNKELQDSGYTPLRVLVNLSPRQFYSNDLYNIITNSLQDYDLSPAHFGVELTESCAMQDITATIQTLEKVRSAGVKVAIDDFGTGFSSLNCLWQLPCDVLKIDKSFVSAISLGSDSEAIISVIIRLAHQLDLTVVAEGVETVDQLAFLKIRNCNSMQGFHFCKPVPLQTLKKLLPKVA